MNIIKKKVHFSKVNRGLRASTERWWLQGERRTSHHNGRRSLRYSSDFFLFRRDFKVRDPSIASLFTVAWASLRREAAYALSCGTWPPNSAVERSEESADGRHLQNPSTTRLPANRLLNPTPRHNSSISRAIHREKLACTWGMTSTLSVTSMARADSADDGRLEWGE